MRNLLFALLLLSAWGCKEPRDAPRSAAGEAARVPASAPEAPRKELKPGEFRVAELGTTAEGATRYLASTGEAPGACQFEVVIEKGKQDSDTPFSFAKAALVRRQGADCAGFLGALAKELAFTGGLPRPARSDRLSAAIAILGTNQSRSSNGPIAGGFTSKPPGSWMATKLFLADGEGEVFMNLNTRDGFGEFSIKDEEYATIVVTELAKVLM